MPGPWDGQWGAWRRPPRSRNVAERRATAAPDQPFGAVLAADLIACGTERVALLADRQPDLPM